MANTNICHVRESNLPEILRICETDTLTFTVLNITVELFD